MTNREWIESLSDEELAKWIENTFVGCNACVYCGKVCDGTSVACMQGYKKWLQSEHEKN